MNQKLLSKLLDITKNLEEKNNQIDEIFYGDFFLAQEISDLWNLIGEYIGLPENIDPLFNLLHDFGNGVVSKEETMKELINWNEMFTKITN